MFLAGADLIIPNAYDYGTDPDATHNQIRTAVDYSQEITAAIDALAPLCPGQIVLGLSAAHTAGSHDEQIESVRMAHYGLSQARHADDLAGVAVYVFIGGPVALAGADQSVTAGNPVTLSGSGRPSEIDQAEWTHLQHLSEHPDAAAVPDVALTYRWTQTAGPWVTRSDPAAAAPTFTRPKPGPARSLWWSATTWPPAGRTRQPSPCNRPRHPCAPRR